MIQLFFLTATAWAASGGHEAGHHDVHVPWLNVGVQAFNLILLFSLLTFLLRKSVKAHFAHRANDYQQLVQRAQAAKDEAERGRQEIQTRLNKLESGAEEGLAQARREAAELKLKLQSEAKELSAKLEADAKRTAQVELEKAKDELRRELLESALQASSNTLRTSLSSGEQKRLQDEFAKKIQVVGQ
jgi:F-type H+-transporting ATPase subunit b